MFFRNPKKHEYYDEVSDHGLDLYFKASRIHSPTLRRKSMAGGRIAHEYEFYK